MNTLSLCMLLFLPYLASQNILLARSSRDVVEEVEQIDAGDLTSDQRLLTIATEFLNKHPNNRLLHLVLLTRAKDVSSIRFGKGVTDITYSMWKSEYQQLNSRVSPQAELLGLAGASTLRVRTADGNIRYLSITGRNAFQIDTQAERLQIDFVAFHETFPYSQPTLQVTFFVRGSVANQKAAKAVSQHLFSTVGIPNVEAVIRSDSWFIDDTNYPWVNPYLKVDRIPSYEEYAKVTTWACRDDSCLPLRALAAP